MANPTSEPSWGLRRQIEIYQAGLAGRTPAYPVSVDDLELKAKSVLTTEAFDYLAGAAGSEDTMCANRDAFRRWRIVPRLLRDVSRRDLGVKVLGLKLRAPIMLAPIGVQSILHEEGELAVARAARSLAVPMILSTAASHTMEDVAVLWAMPHAGFSSTGPGMMSWRPASFTAPSRRATERSW